MSEKTTEYRCLECGAPMDSMRDYLATDGFYGCECGGEVEWTGERFAMSSPCPRKAEEHKEGKE